MARSQTVLSQHRRSQGLCPQCGLCPPAPHQRCCRACCDYARMMREQRTGRIMIPRPATPPSSRPVAMHCGWYGLAPLVCPECGGLGQEVV